MDKATIMIVEDENIVAEDIKMTLLNLGYSVSRITNNAKDAIAYAQEDKPSIILMDINLRGEMDGIEAAKKINSSLEIPVIFLTAYAGEKVLDRAKKARPFGYIVKPFEEYTLNSTIQIVLQKYREIEKTKLHESETDLDTFDRKILYEIMLDSRMPASEISKRVHLPKSTISYRISKLAESKYICKFLTLYNASVLGYKYYRIYIKFQNLSPENEVELLQFLNSENSCVRFRTTEATSEVIMYTVNQNMDDVRRFLEKLNKKFGDFLEKEISPLSKSHIFSHRYLTGVRDYTYTTIDYENTENAKADNVDLKIIGLMANNTRTKLVDIAEQLGLDWKVVKYRIKKMKERKLIVRHTAEIDLWKVGRKIVQIDMSLNAYSSVPEIIKFLNNSNSCLSVNEMLGKFDLSADLCIRDHEMLENILTDFRKAFPNVSFKVSRVYHDNIINAVPFALNPGIRPKTSFVSAK